MKVRLIIPSIYGGRLYLNGTVLDLNPMECARLVRRKVAVPEPDTPGNKTIRPTELRFHG